MSPGLSWRGRAFSPGYLMQRVHRSALRPEDLQHRSADSGVDRRVRSAARLRRRRRSTANERKRPQVTCGFGVACPSTCGSSTCTDPAISRKRDIEGQMVKTFENLRVARDRALGGRDAYVRHHDRHRRLHRERCGEPQLLRQADARLPGLRRRPGFRAEIVVKVNAPELLRVELASLVEGRACGAWHKHDPYQWSRVATS